MGGGNEGRGRPHRCPPQNTGWLEAGASLAGGQDPKGTVGFAGHALCAQPPPDSPLWLSFLVPTGRHRHSSPVMSFRPEGSVLCSKERRPIRPTRQQDQLQPPGSLRWSPERRRAVPPCSSRSLRSIWLPRGPAPPVGSPHVPQGRPQEELVYSLHSTGDRPSPHTAHQWAHFLSRQLPHTTTATVPAASSQRQLPLLLPSPRNCRSLPPCNCPSCPSPLPRSPQLPNQPGILFLLPSAPDTHLTAPTLSSLGRRKGHFS